MSLVEALALEVLALAGQGRAGCSSLGNEHQTQLEGSSFFLSRFFFFSPLFSSSPRSSDLEIPHSIC